MNKVLLYTDCHFTARSSIVQSYGDTFTTRLENEIASLNWAEKQAIEQGCDAVICLGDFFDKPSLTDMEITALNSVEWSNLPHYFIVGNHEGSKHSLKNNTTSIFKNLNYSVIDEPKTWNYNNDENQICFLPYIHECDRKTLTEYFGEKVGKRIVLSHNDIKGIRYGMFESKEGFDLKEIDSTCDIFVNGHLHNGTAFSKKGINLGNLTGQNFTEDAFVYTHDVGVLDLDTCQLTKIENPHALNFYSIRIVNEADLKTLDVLKNNAVLSIAVKDELVETVNNYICKRSDIVASRVTVIREYNPESTETNVFVDNKNYKEQFSQFFTNRYGKNQIVLDELAEVCK